MGLSIAALLGVVIYLIARGDKQPEKKPDSLAEDGAPVVLDGQTVKREELPASVKLDRPAEPIKRDERIRETLQAGKTYRVVQKVGFAVKGEDPDWGSRELIKIGYMGELLFTRTIESNDGQKLVEVRDIEVDRIVKVLAGAGDFTIDTGAPDKAMLTVLDGARINRLRAIEPARKIVEAIVTGAGKEAVANDKATKAFGVISTLSGKKVRLTSINGKGVVGIEPIGCTLTAWEREYFFNKDLLAYTRMFVDLDVKPGESWTFNAGVFSELMELIDPSPRQRVGGQIEVTRGVDVRLGDRQLAVLTINPAKSELRVTETDDRSQVFGTLRPKGEMRYVLGDNYIQSAIMDSDVRVEAMPKDSPLTKATFVEEARIKMTYSCERR